MKRSRYQQAEPPSHDSLLDIVANIVGILIILVMVTGARARNRSTELVAAEADVQASNESQDERIRALRTELAARDNQIGERVESLGRLGSEYILQSQAEAQAITQVAALEKAIEADHGQLDADARSLLDLKSQVHEARDELERIDRRRIAAIEETPEAVRIESYPTPLSQQVDGEELHFQLRAGRLAHIPLDGLLVAFESDAQNNAHRLLKISEVTETVGPIGGFRLRYTLVRRDLPPDASSPAGHSIVHLKKWTLIPVSSELGETLEEASTEGSRFRTVIGGYRGDTTTVTVWVYNDSFDAFRLIKRELFQHGFSIAARPLPADASISGSPEGSKSAAQ